MSSTFLERTSSNSSNNQRIGTISVWLKRAKLGTTQYILANYIDGNNYGYFRFDSSDRLHYVNAVSGSHSTDVVTTRKFRDLSGWYHFCVAVDSTQGTASNRVKIYVNGTQETAFDTGSYGSQDDSHRMWMASASGGHRMGSQQTTQSHFDGCMSHFHFIDGTAYTASSFGSTDSTTGEWKINTSPSVTYGSEGYFMLKNDNSLTDQSGEGNNFIVGNGTFTKTEDNPSNVFATLNPLTNLGTTSRTITNGNTTFNTSTTAWGNILSTLGFSSGKFYCEVRLDTLQSSQGYGALGVTDASESYDGNDNIQQQSSFSAGCVTDHRSGQSACKSAASTVSSNIGNFATNNDIVGIAADMDNKALYLHKNGTYLQIGGVTGVPTSGSSKTGAITIPATCETCVFSVASYTTDCIKSVNFGNGYFGTTAVTSNSGNGYSGTGSLGIFQYQPPTGYTALCTKGLNE